MTDQQAPNAEKHARYDQQVAKQLAILQRLKWRVHIRKKEIFFVSKVTKKRINL